MPSSANNPGAKSGTLFVVSAPSGAGKTSLLRALVDADSTLQQTITTTTRAPRDGEVDGVDYHFLSHREFKRRINAGEFLEYANVFGNLYGLTRDAVEPQLARGEDVLVILDVQGAATVKNQLPDDVVSIFILPPSAAEMRQRLDIRGQNDEADLQKRLLAARSEFAEAVHYDYLLVNDDFLLALGNLMAVIRAERLVKNKPYLLTNLLPQFIA